MEDNKGEGVPPDWPTLFQKATFYRRWFFGVWAAALATAIIIVLICQLPEQFAKLYEAIKGTYEPSAIAWAFVSKGAVTVAFVSLVVALLRATERAFDATDWLKALRGDAPAKPKEASGDTSAEEQLVEGLSKLVPSFAKFLQAVAKKFTGGK